MAKVVCPRDTKFDAFSFGTESLNPSETNLNAAVVFIELPQPTKRSLENPTPDITLVMDKIINYAQNKSLTLSGMKQVYLSPAQLNYFKFNQCRIKEGDFIVLSFSGPYANEALISMRKDLKSEFSLVIPEDVKKINKSLGYLFCGRLFSELWQKQQNENYQLITPQVIESNILFSNLIGPGDYAKIFELLTHKGCSIKYIHTLCSINQSDLKQYSQLYDRKINVSLNWKVKDQSVVTLLLNVVGPTLDDFESSLHKLFKNEAWGNP